MKKNYFYIGLLIIYILFLTKDSLFNLIGNKDNIENYLCSKDNLYYKEEYKDLAKLMNVELANNKVIYSKIIFRDIYKFYDKITISKGINDGIRVGDAVINEYGIIGVVAKTYKNYSEVNLITNNKMNISVKINDSYGILSCENDKIIVKNIKLNNEIKALDKVYTSGLTAIPEGLYIGEVESVNKDNLELEYVLDIGDFKNYINLKYVGVVTS